MGLVARRGEGSIGVSMDDLEKAKAILSKLESEIKNVSAELAVHKTSAVYVEGVGRILLSIINTK